MIRFPLARPETIMQERTPAGTSADTTLNTATGQNDLGV